MEELIFFAVIIIFSIVESIARSRRAKRGEAEGDSPLPDLSQPERWEPPGRSEIPEPEPLPTYDADPSYDDIATSRGRRSRRDQPSPMRGGSESEERGRPSAEMLSADLLEELAELADRRSREPQRRSRLPRPVRVPRQSPPLPEPVAVDRRVARHPVEATEIGEHEVHRSHAGYGTDPSTRPISEQDVLFAPREHLSADASAVRRQLLSQSASSLRRAIILQEVLGPPIALRQDDTFE